MVSRIPFYLLVALLLVIGLGSSIYRHEVYGVPWTNGQERQLWEVEARVEFKATGQPVKVSLAIPDSQKGFTLINENTSSSGYGFTLVTTPEGRRAEWSKREANGNQTLYFKNQLLLDDNAQYRTTEPDDEIVVHPFDGILQTAAETILTQAHQRSSDNATLTRELIKQFDDPQNQNASLLLNSIKKSQAITEILAMANIHSRVVGTLLLEDGRRRQSVTSAIEIWNGNEWSLFDLKTGDQINDENLLVWNETNGALLDVIGGNNSQVKFSIIAQDISPQLATDKLVQTQNLLNFSIHSLPIEEQALFKTILLIPIGALIVVILRILVGLKTSGTFMPVLIAVSFVQTQLIPGIIGFVLVVGTGLFIRSYLSKLNLLLVSRISAVIITVILIISLFTIVAFKIGLVQGLSITFFPMIILSWTIERMSILWEEEGAKHVLVQVGGSLLTAIIVYLAMTNEFIRYITFNFIGIQLVILAVILMLGNYTGYRLSELKRFKPLIRG